MRKLLLPLLLFSVVAISALAQNHSSEFGAQSDNDSYLGGGSDRYYTDGLFLFYRHALDVKTSATLKNKVLGFEVGQKIFNPYGGNIVSVLQVDRPFAGYLYAGANLNFLHTDESNLKVGVQVGIIGPASGAKEAQTWVHKNFGFYTPSGWEYQIRNNLQLNLSADYNKLLGRGDFFIENTKADATLATYANLGTGFAGVGIGALLRAGKVNQLFNSASTQSTTIADKNFTPANKHEFFVYLKPMLNVVAYDATIQGGLFQGTDPTGVEIRKTPERIIASSMVGLTYTTNRWVFDAAATFRSKDIDQLAYRRHQWGSVTALYRFN
ncbi:lipid A deacylase LpxR family protein [Mucilaginibacter antarcticus]|uniref:Lipid A deacylase LpxR family protein n=1 Tax=Mucilaginibacter antarcticus TaxID=1855725 RepID=A0ABW5XMI0_9SPHI